MRFQFQNIVLAAAAAITLSCVYAGSADARWQLETRSDSHLSSRHSAGSYREPVSRSGNDLRRPDSAAGSDSSLEAPSNFNLSDRPVIKEVVTRPVSNHERVRPTAHRDSREGSAVGIRPEVGSETGQAERVRLRLGGQAKIPTELGEDEFDRLDEVELSELDVKSNSNPNRKSIPLLPPASSPATDRAGSKKGSPWTQPHVTSTLASLGVVLGAFFLLAWFVQRNKSGSGAKLPAEAVEILGRIPWEGKHQLQIIRFGPKLLLLSVAAGTTQTLAEITDPDDVEHVLELCQKSRPGSVSDSFRQVLAQLGREPTNRGFLPDRDLEEIVAGRESSRSRQQYEA